MSLDVVFGAVWRFVFLSLLFIFPSAALATPIEIGESYQLGGRGEFYLPDGNLSSLEILSGSSFQFSENGVLNLDIHTSSGNADIDLGFDLAEFDAGRAVQVRPAILQNANAIIAHLNAPRFSPLDTNRDGIIAPIDALILINQLNQGQLSPIEALQIHNIVNYLNANGAGPANPADLEVEYIPELDTNMDGEITQADALIILNALNNGGTSETLQQIGIFSSASGDFFNFIAMAQSGVFNLDDPSNLLTILAQQFAADGSFLGQIEFMLNFGDVNPGALNGEVPEPATMLLLGAGLLGALRKRAGTESAAEGDMSANNQG